MLDVLVSSLGNTLVSLAISFVCIIIPLSVLHLLQKCFILLSIRKPNIFNRITGIIAVPVHEFSHWFACRLFGHKVLRVSWYNPLANGTLGFVEHSYNPLNPRHVIGCFFIGISPIFGGVLMTGLLTVMLLPNGQEFVSALLSIVSIAPPAENIIPFYAELNWNILTFTYASLLQSTVAPFQFLVWATLVSAIGLYLTPSRADMVGSAKGFVFIVAVLLLTDIFIRNDAFYSYLTVICMAWSALLVVCMCLSLISLGLLIVAQKIVKH